MKDCNTTTQIGRLVRDAELKYTSGGRIVSKFSIAVNKSWKRDGEEIEVANFFDVVLWGKIGEVLHPYLVKGKQVCITGELTQHRYERDGVKRQRVFITAEYIQLLGGGHTESAGKYNTVGGAVDTQDVNPSDDIPF